MAGARASAPRPEVVLWEVRSASEVMRGSTWSTCTTAIGIGLIRVGGNLSKQVRVSNGDGVQAAEEAEFQ